MDGKLISKLSNQLKQVAINREQKTYFYIGEVFEERCIECESKVENDVCARCNAIMRDNKINEILK